MLGPSKGKTPWCIFTAEEKLVVPNWHIWAVKGDWGPIAFSRPKKTQFFLRTRSVSALIPKFKSEWKMETSGWEKNIGWFQCNGKQKVSKKKKKKQTGPQTASAFYLFTDADKNGERKRMGRRGRQRSYRHSTITQRKRAGSPPPPKKMIWNWFVCIFMIFKRFLRIPKIWKDNWFVCGFMILKRFLRRQKKRYVTGFMIFKRFLRIPKKMKHTWFGRGFMIFKRLLRIPKKLVHNWFVCRFMISRGFCESTKNYKTHDEIRSIRTLFGFLLDCRLSEL